jgi:carboxypeptidase C (cathepsin A)
VSSFTLGDKYNFAALNCAREEYPSTSRLVFLSLLLYKKEDLSRENPMLRFICLLLFSASIFAEKEEPCPEPAKPWLVSSEKWKSTEHTMDLAGKPLAYMAHAGYLDVHDKDGKVTGQIFFTAYIKENESAGTRPVTFVFNGGPGSSSVWLHMGAFGPKRILSEQEGQKRTPPYCWTTNEETILDLTDLVFIDPVGTGFSTTTSETDSQYYEVKKDIESVGDFIRDFITIFQRWQSPKYVAGESYGTTRAAGLSQYLHDNHSIYLNGIILVSVAIDFQTLVFSQGNYLPNALFVPSFAAAAWYHQKTSSWKKPLDQVMKEARNFAFQELLPALYQGKLLPQAEKQKILQKLSNLTGIDVAVLQKYYPHFEDYQFMKELLSSQDLYIGRMDSRYTAPFTNLQQSAAPGSWSDPSNDAINGIFAGALNGYLRDELALNEKYAPYYLLNMKVNAHWVYTDYSLTTLNTMDALRLSMTINPDLKIFVGSGYYDLATPFAAAEYTFFHLDLPENFQKQLSLYYYEGGHMYYLDRKVHRKFKQDLIEFFGK